MKQSVCSSLSLQSGCVITGTINTNLN